MQPRAIWQRSRPWVYLGVGALTIATAAAGMLLSLGYHLRPVQLALLALAGALALATLFAALGPAQRTAALEQEADPWRVRHAVPYASPGRDLRVLRDAHTITAELAGRNPNPELHHRLRELAQEEVRAAYSLDLGSSGAQEVLGERAHELLTGPPRRLSPADLRHVIDRIEEM